MKRADATAPPPADGKELVDLVEEFAARTQAGEPLDLEDYVQAHPSHAEELRKLLPAVQALTDLGRAAAGGPPPVTSCLPAQLGDFRIVREVGRGGMGVVYEAEQVSLGRRVALKVLPSAAALDGKHLQRFKNEAQAAALLQHPHIVPVIAVGEDQGAHFFAMQLIDGHSLGALIADLRARLRAGDPTVILGPRHTAAADTPRIVTEDLAIVPLPGQTQTANETSLQSGGPLPTHRAGRDRCYFRAAARLLVQAARALDHAHQVGVIHRDVKPANFLVEPRGHLWVTDFGLARLHNSPGLTATGDLMGTLRYMSPEQARGGGTLIDHRTDVYSLGVSAYELLTLEYAFPGDDRQDLLRRIVNEDPPRPRRLNRGLPAELEAVVLKAMEKDPADRYATAQEFADDLERYLEDRPVRARRPSRWRVVVKWGRRHAGLVAAAAAAVLAVMAVAVALLTVKNRQLREQEEQTKAALHKVEEQESKTREAFRKAEENAGRARQNAGRALTALNDFLLQLSDEQVRRNRDLARKAERTVAQALKVYEALAKDEDAAVQMGVAQGFFKAGLTYAYLGNADDSKKAHQRSIELFERLAEQHPQDFTCRVMLSMTYQQVAQLHRNAGRREEAATCLRQALECWERPCQIERCPVAVSQAHNSLGEIDAEAGNLASAMAHYRAAIAEVPRLSTITRNPNGARYQLGSWKCRLGQLLQEDGQPDQAEQHLRQAQELAEDLVQNVEDKNGLTREACKELLVRCWEAQGALREQPEPAKALEYYKKALALYSELSAGSPGDANHLRYVANAHFRLGILAWTIERSTEAADHFRAARDGLAKLASDVPEGGPGPGDAGLNENDYAWFLATCPDKSFRDPPRAVTFARKAIERAPSHPSVWNTLGAACLRAGDAKGAVVALEKAAELQNGAWPGDWLFLALAHQRLGEPSKARACFEKGAAWMDSHKAASQELRLLRAEAKAAISAPTGPPPKPGDNPQKSPGGS
jgi:serine/threonine protein kinase/Flp pilus assembly protein TadD